MYLSRARDTFLPCSRSASFKSILERVRDDKSFIHVSEKDGTLTGFLVGQIVRLSHMDEDILQQTYFCTDTTKIETVRIIKRLHEDLLEFGRRNKIRFVLSSGSPVDTDNVFTRALEKYGWQRQGHLAYVDLTRRQFET
jgi:hypothetical protein